MDETTATPRTDRDEGLRQLRTWYDEHAEEYRDAAALEAQFVGLSCDAQRRLNEYKLYALGPAGADPTGKHVLEFGAGHARLAIERPGFASYTGIDLSSRLVEIGRERLAAAGLAERARLIVADCLAYDGPAEAFDVVCALGMFHYMDDPAAVLRKMVYHLKPGGVLFLDCHHSSPLYDWLRRWRWNRGKTTGGGSHLFSDAELIALLGGAGLERARVVMREYPLLGTLYAERSWRWALGLRNRLADRSWLNPLGTDCFAFGVKPASAARAGGSERAEA